MDIKVMEDLGHGKDTFLYLMTTQIPRNTRPRDDLPRVQLPKK